MAEAKHDGEAHSHVHSVGSQVWVACDEEAWAGAAVESIQGKEVVVKKNGKGPSFTVPVENAFLQEPVSHGGVEDMTRMSYLHEPGVLHNLRGRYTLDEIYTYTGSILIAVNPFQRLPHLYNNHMMEQYEGVALGELSPHVYAIAENAFRPCTCAAMQRSFPTPAGPYARDLLRPVGEEVLPRPSGLARHKHTSLEP
mmetsp:Transcript_4573/g.15030  ORF Transcript_4573/g.15030 Transcript_4573/m.15030 type:complete len:197 (+) Transcript_4573:546-1136(+)